MTEQPQNPEGRAAEHASGDAEAALPATEVNAPGPEPDAVPTVSAGTPSPGPDGATAPATETAPPRVALDSGPRTTGTDRPEIQVGAAFAGGFVFAMILRRLAR